MIPGRIGGAGVVPDTKAAACGAPEDLGPPDEIAVASQEAVHDQRVRGQRIEQDRAGEPGEEPDGIGVALRGGAGPCLEDRGARTCRWWPRVRTGAAHAGARSARHGPHGPPARVRARGASRRRSPAVAGAKPARDAGTPPPQGMAGPWHPRSRGGSPSPGPRPPPAAAGGSRASAPAPRTGRGRRPDHRRKARHRHRCRS